MMKQETEFGTKAIVAKWLGEVSVRSVDRMIKAGCPHYRMSDRGKVLLRFADVEAFLQRRSTKPALDGLVEEVLGELVATNRRSSV